MKLYQLYQIFEVTYQETHYDYGNRYNAFIEKAANQLRARNKFLNEAQEQVKQELHDLGNLRHQVEEAWTFDKNVTLKSWIKNYFEENRCSKSEVIRIGKLFGFELFWNDIHNLSFLGSNPNTNDEMRNEETDNSNSARKTSLVWRNQPKVEIIDFLKLAYALHHSGILKAQSENITDTVNELAQRLDFQLPPRWHSNLREGFEGVNADYNHFEFIDEIKNGLMAYITSRDEKKRSQKKKS